MAYLYFIQKFFPNLEILLKQAHLKYTPEKFIQRTLLLSIIFAAILNTPLFFIFLKEKIAAYSLLSFFFFFFLGFFFSLSLPKFAARRRKIEVESDLLYSGRHFLLKLESGQPLINSLIDVAGTDTKSAKYFNEIVTDIYLGKPIEDAIDYAAKYSPSKAFKKLLEQLKNALETGADIKEPLKSTMDEITNQRVVEIQAYGKKLAPLAMFYMIIGTIIPSLGAAMLVIVSNFINIKINLEVFLGLTGLLIIMQFFFFFVFKAVRPVVII